jgi:hypothetical protein
MCTWFLVVALAACGGGKAEPAEPQVVQNKQPETAPPAPSPPNNVVLAQMEAFTAEMCACSESTCAQKVVDRMTEWSLEQAKQTEESPKLTDAEQSAFSELGTRMGTCMQKAMGSSSP